MEKKTGIGYCRVSSDSQEENTSLDDQRQKISAFAQSQDIDLIKIFQDVASGGVIDREGYQAALKCISENSINCFIVAKLDRAHRHQENLLVFERELREKEIAFLSVAELIDSSSPTGRLMFQILGSFAEFERNQINERTRNGRKAKLAKNEYAGGRPPIGYDKKWKVVHREIEIVKNIFRQYLSLGTTSKVKQYCNNAGYKGRNGKNFSKQAISLILKNRAYLGEYSNNGKKECNGVIVKSHHKPIIVSSIFGRVQKLMQVNCRNPNKAEGNLKKSVAKKQ